MGDVEEQEWEWDWGRRLHSLPPSPRGQSLQGQAAGGKQQPRGAVPAPGPLGAAAGLSTNVRLKRAMALVPQAAAAMGIADPAEFFLHRLERIWEAPNKGRDGEPSTRIRAGPTQNGPAPHVEAAPGPQPRPRSPAPHPFGTWRLLPPGLALLNGTHLPLREPSALQLAFPPSDRVSLDQTLLGLR